MFDEEQKKAVMRAYTFAHGVGKEHIRYLEKNRSSNALAMLEELRSEHTPEELKKCVLDLAIEYHYWKAPSSNYGLIPHLEDIETELRSLITKFESLKKTAPNTFDEIAYLMHSPYVRSGEFKTNTFTYYDPQIELNHLTRAVSITKSDVQKKGRAAKKRGFYWKRIERVWQQITYQSPQRGQSSGFIKFSEMVFNSGKSSEDRFESAEALSKDYRRYLEVKRLKENI
ncbi:hypothetical protein [Vibrio campbellii]|uniref:hypothetical protein n=1 Tax=Vibrio campbellii TaxID=680 RepID=UPI0005EFBC64|nr:hypothetical protein [Vibrio campbellii]